MLNFPEFNSIKVSTKTFTASTNLNINIKELYEILPITNYTVIPRKRGRKKKINAVDPNKDIQQGSIITVQYENNTKGVDFKPSKNKSKWFRNSITVIIMLDKLINFKICRNGTFQMTGCKKNKHAEMCIKYIWEYMKSHSNIYKITDGGDCLKVMIIPSMRNIDFSLGFLVDRDKLNAYMNSQTKFHCILETSFGYTGVNIKVPITKDRGTMKIRKLIYAYDRWIEEITTFGDYLNSLSSKDKKSKIKECKYNTFLIFHSGKAIMSGITKEYMRESYYYFLSMIKECHSQIEEKLDIV